MSASVVVGQTDFTSNIAGSGNSHLQTVMRGVFIDANDRLIVTDFSNNRVLVWNKVPTSNGTPADLVLGQPDFNTVSANTGGRSASSMSGPNVAFSDGTRLFISEESNNRVLIWNSFPTTNGQAADVVVGQADFSSAATTCNSSTLSAPEGVFVYQNKLIVASRNQRRVLIWDTIPTTNGIAANMVLGKTSLSDCAIPTTSASSLGVPRSVQVDSQGKLIIADGATNRVLIWNVFPTTNGQSADVVVGQSTFLTSSSGITASSFNNATAAYSSGNRLFVSDNTNNRILLFNTVPTSNGASADIVIGQPNMTSSATNQGGTIGANTLFQGRSVFVYHDKLLTGDSNARVLIFNNIINNPGLSLNNSPENRENNLLRFHGSARVASPYSVNSVQFAINGGGFSNATPSDGGFNSTSEEFYFDFDPTSNQPKESSGYTIQLKGINNNADLTDHLFYFSPLNVNSPANNATMKESYPVFDFSVNKQRTALSENVDHYAVEVRDRSSGQGWTTLIDSIPVDFASHKGDIQNTQRATWESLSVVNGSYETADFLATYSEDGSRIQVRSKSKPLTGSYEWKVVAVDKAGHAQETGSRNLFLTGQLGSVTNGFPLAILNISGLGNPHISSYNLAGIKSTYRTSSTTPIFYGIAWSGATVHLNLTEQKCTDSCTQTFSTNADFSSRFGINIPKGSVKYGKTYDVNTSVSLEDRFTQLPTFTLQVGQNP